MTSAAGRMLRNDKGLTLLELMLSIVLIGAIVLVVSGALRLGYRSAESGEKKVSHLERFRSSLAIINAQVQSLVPLTSSQGGEKKFLFEGTSDFLRLSTNYSIWGGLRGHVQVEYRVETDDRGVQSLVAAENLVGAEKKNEVLLLHGFNAIFFEFFDEGVAETAPLWIDEWTDTNRIPRKIRLRLLQGRKETLLVIPIRAQGSLARLYLDPVHPEGLKVNQYA